MLIQFATALLQLSEFSLLRCQCRIRLPQPAGRGADPLIDGAQLARCGATVALDPASLGRDIIQLAFGAIEFTFGGPSTLRLC